VKPLDQWSVRQRAVFTNAIAAVGVYIGFASSGVKLSVDLETRIAVFIIAFMNLILLVVRPRIVAQNIAGGAAANPWRVVYEALAERPFITALTVLQLWGGARAAGTTIVFAQTAASDYVRSQPNAASMSQRLVWSSMLLVAVAFLWLLSAIGVWQRRLWAWWVALVLDGLAATTTIVLQFATTFLHLGKPSGFLLALSSTAAVVFLLLPCLRTDFRKSSHEATCAPAVSPGGT
jgi:uncharacterized membrane protein (DUF2068 family)